MLTLFSKRFVFSSFLCVWSSLYIKVFHYSQCSDFESGLQLTLVSSPVISGFHFCVYMISFISGYAFHTLMLLIAYRSLTIPWLCVCPSCCYITYSSPLTVQRVLPMIYIYIPRVVEISWLQLWPLTLSM